MLTTPAVLHLPVRGATGWGGTQKRNCKMGETDKISSRNSSRSRSRRRRSSSGSTRVVVAV